MLKLTGLLADKPFTVQTYEQYLNLSRQAQGIDTERKDEKRKLENGTDDDDATFTDVQIVPKKSKLFDEADW